MRKALAVAVVVLFVALFALGVGSRFESRYGNEKHGSRFRAADPESACGPVAVAVTSRILGQPVALNDVNELIGLPPSGATSMLDLKKAFDKLGFHAEGKQFERNFKFDIGTRALVLHLAYDHFVTVIPIDEQTCVLLDPPRSPKIETAAGLHRTWDGTALILN